MTNKELFEYVKDRFDKIELELKPLIEYKAKSEGTLATLKYVVTFGFAAFTIMIALITYLK